jgi:hypothetical protein
MLSLSSSSQLLGSSWAVLKEEGVANLPPLRLPPLEGPPLRHLHRTTLLMSLVLVGQPQQVA